MTNNILIFGDILFDVFGYGDVDRLCPEAPVPVLTKIRRECSLGGAGNVATTLAKIMPDYRIVLVGRWNEKHTELLTQELPKNLFILPDFYLDGEPNIKHRYIDRKSGYQLLRVDNEKMLDVQPLTGPMDSLFRAFDPKVVVFSDYCKGALKLHSTITNILDCANCPTIVDTKEYDLTKYKYVDYITPNKKELSKILEINKCSIRALIMDFCLTGVLLTRSEEGMDLYSADTFEDGTHFETMHLKTRVRDLVDVTGAGDTALAGFVAGLARGYDQYKSMWLANYYAAEACKQHGTNVLLSEFTTALSQYDSSDFSKNTLF